MVRNVFHLQSQADLDDNKNSNTIDSTSELKLDPTKCHENAEEVQSVLPAPASFLVLPSLLQTLTVPSC